MNSHQFDSRDGTEINHNGEWVKCARCKTMAMAKCVKEDKVKTKGHATYTNKDYRMPEGWIGNVGEVLGEMAWALCPRCVGTRNQVDDYRTQWGAVEQRRLQQLKARARCHSEK